MNYIEYIERTDANNGSVTWTCPKTGKWKVICVGGGASGALFVAQEYIQDSTSDGCFSHITGLAGTGFISSTIFTRFSKNFQESGETTSFGDILSVNGGQIYTDRATRSYIRSGGYGGYTVANGMGGNPATESLDSQQAVVSHDKNGGELEKAGMGYGAGGGSKVNIFTATVSGQHNGITPNYKLFDSEDALHLTAYVRSYATSTETGTLNYHSILSDLVVSYTSDGSTSNVRYQRAYPLTCAGGYAGDLSVNITELTKGDTVKCTVGAGGSISSMSDYIDEYLASFANYLRYSGSYFTNFPYESKSFNIYVDCILVGSVSSTNVYTPVSNQNKSLLNSLITPGNDGVIILQYLGE
jgi:hypothetical protein